MNKKIVMVGIAVLLICVGISGCLGETSIKDVLEHPDKYVNKEITIKGYYTPALPPDASIAGRCGAIVQKKIFSDEYQDIWIAIIIPTNIDASNLVYYAEYEFTGIVKKSDYGGTSYVYMDISDIKPV